MPEDFSPFPFTSPSPFPNPYTEEPKPVPQPAPEPVPQFMPQAQPAFVPPQFSQQQAQHTISSFSEPPAEFYKEPEKEKKINFQTPADVMHQEYNQPKAIQETFEEDFSEDLRRIFKKATVFFIVIIVLATSGWYLFKGLTAKDGNFIKATEGGKITTDFGVEIDISAGALKADTRISVENTGNGAVTDVYRFSPEGLVFTKPVTMWIPYKESGLKSWETPWGIKLEYWKEGLSARKIIRIIEVDKKTKRLKVKIDEF